MAKINWTLRTFRLDELTDYYKNPRSLSEKEFKQLKTSLDKFGMIDKPIVNLDSANTIIGGHQRKHVMEATGVKECECWIPDRELSEKEVEELNIRLNKNTGSWDFDTLANEFELDDLLEWGFDKGELDLDLWADEAPEDVEPQIDKAEELRVKWGVESGQLWQLGEHRLICGDCTDKAVVERVMGGELADCMWTDPPYGVDYVGKTKDALRIDNDGRTGLVALIHGAISVAAGYMAQISSFYVAAPPGPQLFDFAVAIRASGLTWRQSLVWVKDVMVLGHSDYHYMHEVIFYGSKGKHAKFHGGRKQVTVLGNKNYQGIRKLNDETWQLQLGNDVYLIHGQGIDIEPVYTDVLFVDRPTRSKEHPTMKPVELVEQMVKNSTENAAIVYEPFSGSGTTIIACERLGRKCRAVEISPAYVAVAIQRWVDVTGKEPVLLDT